MHGPQVQRHRRRRSQRSTPGIWVCERREHRGAGRMWVVSAATLYTWPFLMMLILRCCTLYLLDWVRGRIFIHGHLPSWSLSVGNVEHWKSGQEAVILDGPRRGYRGVKDDDSDAVIIGWNSKGGSRPGGVVLLLRIWGGRGCFYQRCLIEDDGGTSAQRSVCHVGVGIRQSAGATGSSPLGECCMPDRQRSLYG